MVIITAFIIVIVMMRTMICDHCPYNRHENIIIRIITN